MSDHRPTSADYYGEWLGMPPGPRPPDYYALLGVTRGEADAGAIKEAARQRMKAVRPRCLKFPEEGSRLLNEIAALPDTVVLVLDDYHVIDSHAVDSALTFLVEHLPRQMQLVVTTREDPRLPLARLRARGL